MLRKTNIALGVSSWDGYSMKAWANGGESVQTVSCYYIQGRKDRRPQISSSLPKWKMLKLTLVFGAQPFSFFGRCQMLEDKACGCSLTWAKNCIWHRLWGPPLFSVKTIIQSSVQGYDLKDLSLNWKGGLNLGESLESVKAQIKPNNENWELKEAGLIFYIPVFRNKLIV